MEHDSDAAAWTSASADPAFWISVATLLALALYVWGMWGFDRFTAQGMPFLPALPFVGAAAPFLLRRRDFHRYVQGLYAKGRGPLVGLFHGPRPALLLRDPRLVRRALVEAAAAFPLRAPPPPNARDHGDASRTPHPMLDKHLVGLPWRRWRGVRRELDASLAAALKAAPCLQAVDEAARRLTQAIEIKAAEQPENHGVDIRKPLEYFWSESLGAMIFGQSAGALADDFHRKRTALCAASQARTRWFHTLCPRFAKVLRFPVIPRDSEKYFYNIGDDMAETVKKSWLQGHTEDAVISEDFRENLRKSSALWHMLDSNLADNTTGKKNETLEWRSKSSIFPLLEVVQPTRKKSLKMPKVEITLTPITEEIRDTVHSISTLSLSSNCLVKSSLVKPYDHNVRELKERSGEEDNKDVTNTSRTGSTNLEETMKKESAGRDIVDSVNCARKTIDGNVIERIPLIKDIRCVKGNEKVENLINSGIREKEGTKTNIKETQYKKELITNSKSDIALQPTLSTFASKFEENHEIETTEAVIREIEKTEKKSQTSIVVHTQKCESTQIIPDNKPQLNVTCDVTYSPTQINLTTSSVSSYSSKLTHSEKINEISDSENSTIESLPLVSEILDSEKISRTKAATAVAEAQVTKAMGPLASKFWSPAKKMSTSNESASSVSASDAKVGVRISPVTGEIVISKEETRAGIFGSVKRRDILKTEVTNSKLVGHILVEGMIIDSRKIQLSVRSKSENNIIAEERMNRARRGKRTEEKVKDDAKMLISRNSKEIEISKATNVLEAVDGEVGDEMKKTRRIEVKNPETMEDEVGAKNRSEPKIVTKILTKPKNVEREEKESIDERNLIKAKKVTTLENSKEIGQTEMIKELKVKDLEETRAKLQVSEHTEIISPKQKQMDTKSEKTIFSVVESTKETGNIGTKETEDQKSEKEITRENKSAQETIVRRRIGVTGDHPQTKTKEEPTTSSKGVPQIKVEPEEGTSEATFHQAARSCTASLAAQMAEGARRGALLVALALRLLAAHPEAQRRAAAEATEAAAAAAFEGEEGSRRRDAPYIDAVIAETLRLWPPEAVVTRARLGAGPWRGDGAAAAALGVGTSSASSVTLQPDDVLWVPIAALHRDPKYWIRPSEFVPERFLPTLGIGSSLEGVGEGYGASDQGVYLPFGLGPRACAGRDVALHVAKSALLCVLAKFEFLQPTRRRGQPRALMWKYSLDIEGGCSLVVKRRNEK